jgi:lantibiotic leader peptide-processing serine protease
MRRWKLAAMVVGSVVLAACNEAPESTSPEMSASFALVNEPSQKVAGRHGFMMHSGRKVSELASAIAAAGGTISYSMDDIGVLVVNGLSDAAAAKIASGRASVASDLSARWIPTPSARIARSVQLDAIPVFEGRSLLLPQAAAFGFLQWNIRITDTDDAWNQGKTGIPGVKVAILDTGLDFYHIEQRNLIDLVSSRAFAKSVSGPPDWEDDNTHGTHVGGVVTSNNIVMAGVAPNVTLVAVKVLAASGEGTLLDIISGIYYAANIGVDVINMSFGATVPKNEAQGLVPIFNRAVNYAHSRGVFIAAAAGNDGEDLQHNGNRISVPCETGVLSCISATGSLDLPAYYTNYGTDAINNAAPGGDFTQPLPPAGPNGILGPCSSRSVVAEVIALGCTQFDPRLPGVGVQYIFVEGTSAAAPHISGLAALLDSQFGGQLNGSQILTAIQQNADDLGKPGADEFYGKGRMNTCRTLQQLPLGPDCVPAPNP